MAALYSTMNGEGVDVNSVFILDVASHPEYPAPPFAVVIEMPAA